MSQRFLRQATLLLCLLTPGRVPLSAAAEFVQASPARETPSGRADNDPVEVTAFEATVEPAVAGHWRSMPDGPTPRAGHQAFWTGSEMLVFGGSGCGSPLDRFDPATSSWSTPDATGAPGLGVAVWDGSELLVHGRERWWCPGPRTGSGRFDPRRGVWSPMNDGPTLRAGASFVWTGREAILFGGSVETPAAPVFLGDGGRYHPPSDSWRPISTVNAPSPRAGHVAVWTGSRMFVWGGYDRTGTDTLYSVEPSGGLYDPDTDSWRRVSTVNAPPPALGITATMLDGKILVWNGYTHLDRPTVLGGIYDPIGDSWTPLRSVPSRPEGDWICVGTIPFSGHTTILAGDAVVTFGGSCSRAAGVFDPISLAWRALSQSKVPTGRGAHSAVWTGSELIVFGGYGFTSYDPIRTDTLSSGGIWSPNPQKGTLEAPVGGIPVTRPR